MTKTGWKKRTIKDMKSLGTYKPEFEPLIDVYAGMLAKKDEYEMTEDIEPRRMEVLRRDLITYSDRLLLNPKSRESVEIKVQTTDKLTEALEALGG
jgi:adenylate cyclase class IV